MAEKVSVLAEWQPSLACFCPSCKLHVNILRVPVDAGSVRDAALKIGDAYEGELLAFVCPNCGASILVSGLKPGATIRLAQIVGEGRAESHG